MSEQTEAWGGDFGDAYLIRNRVDWRLRLPFWKKIMDLTNARSVLEAGCNAGWNLSAIREVAPTARLRGMDVNMRALQEAMAAGLDVAWAQEGIDGLPALLDGWVISRGCELVFTAGVLIHVPEEDLERSMQVLIDASTEYVLAVEYEAAQSHEILYRGEPKRLWKRPFGAIYLRHGLNLIDTGYLGKRTGFDECTYWLMKKQ